MAKKIILFEVVVGGCSELGAGDGNEGDGGGLESSGASEGEVRRLVSHCELLAGGILSCLLYGFSFTIYSLAFGATSVHRACDSLSITLQFDTVGFLLNASTFFQVGLCLRISLNGIYVFILSLAFVVSVKGHLKSLWAIGSRDNGDESGDSSVLHILVYLINYINVFYSVL